MNNIITDKDYKSFSLYNIIIELLMHLNIFSQLLCFCCRQNESVCNYGHCFVCDLMEETCVLLFSTMIIFETREVADFS